MAKYEARLHGDFDDTLRYIHEGILNASMSASFEDESYFQSAGVRCCVRVYERYSFGGGNRVSPSPAKVMARDTRLPPPKLYRSYTRTQQRTPADWK